LAGKSPNGTPGGTEGGSPTGPPGEDLSERSRCTAASHRLFYGFRSAKGEEGGGGRIIPSFPRIGVPPRRYSKQKALAFSSRKEKSRRDETAIEMSASFGSISEFPT